MKMDLFSANPRIPGWMVEYTATNGGTVKGSSSIVFRTNYIPYGGSCTADQQTGIALYTKFTVACSDWLDSDGTISSYELLGNQIYFFSAVD